MAEMRSIDPRFNLRLLALQVLSIAVIVTLGWVLWQYNKPERFPSGSSYSISLTSHGKIYKVVPHLAVGDGRPRIYCRLITGKDRLLVQEDGNYDFYGIYGANLSTSSIADGTVFYALKRYHSPKGSMGSGGGGPAAVTKSQYLGWFGTGTSGASTRDQRSAQRLRTTKTKSNPEPILYRCVSQHGGSPRDVVTLRSNSIASVGSYVFWNRPGPETRVDYRMGHKFWSELSGNCELMWTDLVTGKERQIGLSIQSNNTWSRGKDGVFWTALHPYPDTTSDLYYAHASNGAVIRLCTLNRGENVGGSVEFGDSLFWFMLNGAHPAVLMVTDLHGSSIRNLLQLTPHNDELSEATLGVYGNQLYMVAKNLSRDRHSARLYYLARVHPGKSPRFEVLRTLPEDIYDIRFDEAYLYYSIHEVRRGIWQTITDDNAGASIEEVIYRVPLM